MKEKPTSFVISIPMEPVPKGRPRFSRRSGVAFTPAKTRSAEAEMKWHIINEIKRQFGDVNEALFDGPCMVHMTFYFSRPESVKRLYHTVKGDLDNLAKQCGDAGNGLIWRDDSQIISLKAEKEYTFGRSSIFMTVIQLCEAKDNKQTKKKEKENG